MSQPAVTLRACIDVPELEQGIAFYTRVLGLKVGRRSGDKWAELLGASSPIDLISKPAGSAPSPGSASQRDYQRHWTPVHLDFVVTALDEVVRRAQAEGARLDREIQSQDWGRMANLADPFGHGFCLLEFRGRGYDEVLGG